MNTPDPFSQAWNRQQQRFNTQGQAPNTQMPPSPNTALSPQWAQDQGYPPLQNANRPSPPLTLPTSQPLAWNGSSMPNSTSNFGMPQTERKIPDLPPLPNPSTPPSNMSNPWANGNNTMDRTNGSLPPNTPIPPNNKPSFNPKPRRNASIVGKILLFLGVAMLLASTGALLFSSPGINLLGMIQAHTNSQTTIQPTPTPTAHMQHLLLAQQYTAQMSLSDEIAQLLMVEHRDPNYSPDLNMMLNQQHVGAVILYGDAIVSRTQIQNNINSMQQNSKTPIFISIDEEGWNVGRLRPLYPNYNTYRLDADTIGQSGDPNVAAQQGQQTAKDLLSLGINMNLAPDVDISTDDGYIGFDRRSFGSTSDAVIKYAGPYLKALQTNGVVGTIKHFPGLGSIPHGTDPHAVLPVYQGTKDQLYQNDLVPFKHFIQNTDQYEHAYVVMPTDMLVNAIDPVYPAELSHTFMTDILRNQLGFQGVVLSDSLHMGGVLVNGQALSLTDACILALQAGNDILEGASTSTEVQDIIDAVTDAIQSGKLTKAQIDASVTRVLALKMDFNVMPAAPPSSTQPTPTATPTPVP